MCWLPAPRRRVCRFLGSQGRTARGTQSLMLASERGLAGSRGRGTLGPLSPGIQGAVQNSRMGPRREGLEGRGPPPPLQIMQRRQHPVCCRPFPKLAFHA